MKRYGALRIIAGLLKFLGWLTIAAGGLFFVVVIKANQDISTLSPTPYVSPTAVVVVALIIALAIIISGVLTLAGGELITAIVDIATNTARLRAVEQHTQSTVEFFEHMRNRSGASAPPVAAATRS